MEDKHTCRSTVLSACKQLNLMGEDHPMRWLYLDLLLICVSTSDSELRDKPGAFGMPAETRMVLNPAVMILKSEQPHIWEELLEHPLDTIDTTFESLNKFSGG